MRALCYALCMATASVVRNTFTHFSGKIVGTFLGIATIAMMTRYLGQEQFGWYVTAVAFLQIVGILIDFGLVIVTGQMLGELKDYSEKTIVRNLLGFRTLTAAVAYGLAAALIWLFPYTTEIKWAVVLTSVAFFLIAENQILTGIFQKHLKAHWIGLAEVAQRAALFAGVFLVVYKDFGFMPVMAAVVIGNIAQTIVLATRAHRIVPLGFSFEKNIWSIIFKKSWPIAISIAFNLIYLRADVFILSLVRPQTEVGLYGAAYRIMDVTTAIPIIFMGLMVPLLAKSWTSTDKANFSSLVSRSFSALSVVAIPVLVGGALLASPIMKLIAGEEFIASGPIVQVLLIALMGGFLGALFGHTIVAINHQRKTIWIYLLTAIITLVGYLIFIPRYGYMGAAWMTVFSELLAGALLWLYVKKVTRARITLTPLFKSVAASGLMAGSLWLIRDLHVVLLVFIGGAVYTLAMIAVKGISYRDLRLLISTR